MHIEFSYLHRIMEIVDRNEKSYSLLFDSNWWNKVAKEKDSKKPIFSSTRSFY